MTERKRRNRMTDRKREKENDREIGRKGIREQKKENDREKNEKDKGR
jgi:hypothetical protein